MAGFVLCVDVGNSRTKFGLFRQEPAAVGENGLPECLAAAAVSHGQLLNWEKLRRELNVRREDCVVGYLTGSSPEGVSVIREGWPAEWKSPTLLDDVLDFPVKINLEKPNHAGIDRILECGCLQYNSPDGHSGGDRRHGDRDDGRLHLARRRV